jgi:hypothetical protein
MNTSEIVTLFKFCTKQHINEFVKGNLYMNTLRHFAELETEQVANLRSDRYEGLGGLIQADGATFSLMDLGQFTPVAQVSGSIRWHPLEEIRANVFCMYTLYASTGPKYIDERNLQFGDTFAALTDVDKFLDRVTAASQSLPHHLKHRLVEYVNEKEYEGPMGIFRKTSPFAYQNEFRIALYPGFNQPYVLMVGDLSDIVITDSTVRVNQLIRFGPHSSDEENQ